MLAKSRDMLHKPVSNPNVTIPKLPVPVLSCHGIGYHPSHLLEETKSLVVVAPATVDVVGYDFLMFFPFSLWYGSYLV